MSQQQTVLQTLLQAELELRRLLRTEKNDKEIKSLSERCREIRIDILYEHNRDEKDEQKKKERIRAMRQLKAMNLLSKNSENKFIKSLSGEHREFFQLFCESWQVEIDNISFWIQEFENTKRLIRKKTYCKDEEISEHFAKWLNTDIDEQYFDKIDTHPDKLGIQITMSFHNFLDMHQDIITYGTDSNALPNELKVVVDEILCENTALNGVDHTNGLRVVEKSDAKWTTIGKMQSSVLEDVCNFVTVALKRVIYESASEYLCDTMIYSNFIDRAIVSLCEDNACSMFLAKNDEFKTQINLYFDNMVYQFKPKPDCIAGVSEELIFFLFEAKKIKNEQDEE
ncbi:hypothetical protein ROZALSC1DRAFT_31210 [Rozella allomycis CSF55]|uniref:Uncharacterized protein n=1 Tax=Rozella allomycis (strain CSF55) TaxID=988480 RepID=A0A075ANG3_ROZAC|nr:hypothetical protein O9G_005824 [Rozella allomycis CSF55]RKP16943.1 hypothetical protein ROZALSC1DRAFT_31210 [Rozella allomycis CSF55]|eukprot:EPZ31382.1 hypothetical protein O9G_005824 [Rozella allomycis CSF55]